MADAESCRTVFFPPGSTQGEETGELPLRIHGEETGDLPAEGIHEKTSGVDVGELPADGEDVGELPTEGEDVGELPTEGDRVVELCKRVSKRVRAKMTRLGLAMGGTEGEAAGELDKDEGELDKDEEAAGELDKDEGELDKDEGEDEQVSYMFS